MHTKRYKSASLTIELSLLMPGIMAVFILILFLSYFFHDKCVLEQYAYTKAMNEADNTNGNYRDFTDVYGDPGKRLTGLWEVSESIENDDEKVVVTVNGKMTCIDGIFSTYLSDIVFKINISEQAFIKRGPSYIRENSNGSLR